MAQIGKQRKTLVVVPKPIPEPVVVPAPQPVPSQ